MKTVSRKPATAPKKAGVVVLLVMLIALIIAGIIFVNNKDKEE